MARPSKPKQPLQPSDDLKSFATTDDGKAIIELAEKLRAACITAGLPETVQIAGVAPFAERIVANSRAEGFIEGRQYERLQAAYSHVIGAKPQ